MGYDNIYTKFFKCCVPSIQCQIIRKIYDFPNMPTHSSKGYADTVVKKLKLHSVLITPHQVHYTGFYLREGVKNCEILIHHTTSFSPD